MKTKPEIKRLEIVFLGDFNPKIFSPQWFSAQELIGETEAEAAKIEIIHPDVAIFNLSWCRLQVTRERFSVFSEQEAYFEILKDLVIGTFKILEHTPLRAVGVNTGMHIKCADEDEWHRFGHYLVPQAPWEGVFDDSAMQRVELSEKYPPEDILEGSLRIRVEPSRVIRHGIFININDHYGIEVKNAMVGCKKLIDRLIENRESTMEKAEKVKNSLINNFLERS